MGERKVLNKYYPPDFETFKLPKLRRTNQQYVVRLMIPFTMRCLTCGNHVYKGKKFNARKETVEGEKYLGMPIFRFYIRCPVCLSEIAFKTDPENTDYAAEAGAYRTFQAENIARKEEERKQQEKEEDEANNPMLALENRTKESRREMDILDVLEEIRDLNAQQEGVTFQQLMDRHLEREKKEAEEDEQIIDALAKAAYQNESRKIKRVKDDDDNNDLMTSQKKLREEKDEKKTKTKIKMMNLVKRKDQSKLSLQPQPIESHPPTVSQPSMSQAPPTEPHPPTVSQPSTSQAPPTEPHPPTSHPSTSLGLLSTYSDEDSDN